MAYVGNSSDFRYYFVIASVAKQSPTRSGIATGPLALRDDDFLSEI